MFNNKSCFINTLNLIDTLQKNSGNNEKCDVTCSKPFLGDADKAVCLNTRPITFYRCDNSLICVEYNSGCGKTSTSCVFRVESVSGNCVTCRILEDVSVGPSNNQNDLLGCGFRDTNQTTIINLECVCAIKCLKDTYVNI